MQSILAGRATTAAALQPHSPRQASPVNEGTLPLFALEYAPVFYLSANEQWWPTNVAEFLTHVTPEVNGSPVSNPQELSLVTLNNFTSDSYLTVSSDVTSDTDWVKSESGRPNATTGYSAAPVTIVSAAKGNGIVDVFYFIFCAYNRGPGLDDVKLSLKRSLDQEYANRFHTAFSGDGACPPNVLLSFPSLAGGMPSDLTFGNHIGDWEHAMVRFQDGVPQTVYMSQHGSGQAFAYTAVEKLEDGRPVLYIAEGDHAIYATAGIQHYDDLLVDRTDAGHLWDIRQNFRSYHFDLTSGQFALAPTPSSFSSQLTIEARRQTDEQTAKEGVEWLKYTGYWGDKQLPESDPRQVCILGKCRYTDGPNGLYLKNLGRVNVCQDAVQGCVVHDTLQGR